MAGLFDFIGNNAGALVGGLLGAAGSGNTTKGGTETKDPWAPAQPYILKNLQNEADLQNYYQKTPFNAQQQQGYSNLFGDIGNFRDNVAPGLMDFANRGMATNYQRQRGSAPGSIGYGAQPAAPQAAPGPFSVAHGAQVQNPMLDLNGAMNPYTNGSIKPPEPKAQAAMAGGGLLGGGVATGSGGNGGQSAADSPYGGIGIGNYTDKLNTQAQDTFSTYAPISAVGAAVAALMQRGMGVQDAIKAVNDTADPIGALNSLQGWTESDPNYSFYSGDSYSGGVPTAGGYNTGVGSYGGSLWGGGSGGGHSIGG